MNTDKRANSIALKGGRCVALDSQNKIEVDISETFNFFSGVDMDTVKLSFVPPFKEGIFIEKHSDRTGYIEWDTEIKGESMICHLIGYLKIGKSPVKLQFESHSEMNKESSGSYFDVKLDSIITPYAEALSREGEDITEYCEWYIDNVYNKIVVNLYRTFAWFNFLMNNPEYKKTAKSEGGCEMNSMKIKSSPEYIKKIRSRRRICSLWSVSGHYRHYKNGKTVYIAPYLKGKNRKVYINE